MKNFKAAAIVFAAMTLVFTSCESESVEENLITAESRLPLEAGALGKIDKVETSPIVDNTTRNSTIMPQSIEELIANGISVSSGLASFLGNDFDLLIFASDLSIHDPNRLRNAGFFESEIVELVQINLGYNALIGFSPAVPGPGLPVVQDLSQLIGQWNVDSFKTGTVSAFGAQYELVDDLSRFNVEAIPTSTANGFEITSTEFRYTNNETVVNTFQLGTNNGGFLSVIDNGQEVNVFNLPLITVDRNVLTFSFFTRLDSGVTRIASYRLTRG